MNPLRGYAVAVSFLTRVPAARRVPPDGAEIAAASVFYPAVGLSVGAVGASLALLFTHLAAPLLAVAIMVTTIVLTGAFHEDGLADALDGLGGGLSRERALEIMKDSRIGSFGGVGITLLLLGRFALYQAIPRAALPAALLVAGGLSRFGALPVMTFLAYARPQGIASAHARNVGARMLLAGALLPALLAAVGGAPAVCALAVVAVVSGILALWLRSRLGGYTGDTLGLTVCLCEVAALCCYVGTGWGGR